MNKRINKLKSIVEVFGGRYQSDLFYMVTVIFVWSMWLIPMVILEGSKRIAAIISIVLLIFILSKILLIICEGLICECSKKKKEVKDG